MTSFEEAIKTGGVSLEAALALYDELAPVDLDFMRGTWKGADFPSGHPLDGLLEPAGWYGKHFEDAERVHPLLFYTADRRHAFPVDPAKLPMSLPLPKLTGRPLHWLLLGARPVLQTRHHRARLRMTEHRGRVSATMIYDHQPINDVFRRVDDDTVLGAMDMRGLTQPFFFVLRRDASVTIL